MNGPSSELYQAVILDHNRAPRNFRPMDDASRTAEGYNPLCGDQVTVFVKVKDGVVEDVSFQGNGCAISRASASLMTQAVKGGSVAAAQGLFERFHALMMEPAGAVPGSASDGLGKLMVFQGVRAFPMRVKCATLAWHALHAALEPTL
jgi:nitrogen fixation protein NifU and related proteins